MRGEGIIILPHQESPSACLNKKELSQTRANCVRMSPTRANCVRFTPNCKIRHLRREALLGCSLFLELLALTFCEVRGIPVSEWYKFRKSTFKLGLDIPSMVSNFLLWCEMFFYDEKIFHCCLKFGGSIQFIFFFSVVRHLSVIVFWMFFIFGFESCQFFELRSSSIIVIKLFFPGVRLVG